MDTLTTSAFYASPSSINRERDNSETTFEPTQLEIDAFVTLLADISRRLLANPAVTEVA